MEKYHAFSKWWRIFQLFGSADPPWRLGHMSDYSFAWRMWSIIYSFEYWSSCIKRSADFAGVLFSEEVFAGAADCCHWKDDSTEKGLCVTSKLIILFE